MNTRPRPQAQALQRSRRRARPGSEPRRTLPAWPVNDPRKRARRLRIGGIERCHRASSSSVASPSSGVAEPKHCDEMRRTRSASTRRIVRHRCDEHAARLDRAASMARSNRHGQKSSDRQLRPGCRQPGLVSQLIEGSDRLFELLAEPSRRHRRADRRRPVARSGSMRASHSSDRSPDAAASSIAWSNAAIDRGSRRPPRGDAEVIEGRRRARALRLVRPPAMRRQEIRGGREVRAIRSLAVPPTPSGPPPAVRSRPSASSARAELRRYSIGLLQVVADDLLLLARRPRRRRARASRRSARGARLVGPSGSPRTPSRGSADAGTGTRPRRPASSARVGSAPSARAPGDRSGTCARCICGHEIRDGADEELLTDDGRCLEHRALLRREPVDARGQQRLDRGRDGDLVHDRLPRPTGRHHARRARRR